MVSSIINLFKRINGRDFRTFLIFLLISLLVWHIEKLRQDYTEETDLNIVCVNVPEGYVTPPVIEKNVHVRLEGDGFSLMRMYLANKRNIKVDVTPLRRLSSSGQMWAMFIPRRLGGYRTDLPEHIRVTEVFTDTVMIPLLTVKKRKLPVVVHDQVTLMPQFVYSAPRKVMPDSVVVTATNDIIDTMTAVHVTIDKPLTLSDTVVKQVKIELPELAVATADEVTVEYDVEPFAEKKMEIPITPINVADGYSCKVFPPTAKVSFYVGLSQFELADESQFKVVADFGNIRPGDKAFRVRLSLQKAPSFIHNVSFSPSFAEFILERNVHPKH